MGEQVHRNVLPIANIERPRLTVYDAKDPQAKAVLVFLDQPPTAHQTPAMSVVVVPALWVVDGVASDVYLFGETVGVGPDDVWFVEPMQAAFRDAGQLWCEVADAEDLVRSPLFVEHGMSVEPLSARLGAEELERLRAAAQGLGLDPSTLEGLRPWLAGQVLEHTHRAMLGIEAAVGVHEILVGLARTQASRSVRNCPTRMRRSPSSVP